jgi:uncharacterized protein YndB with AHSA1/START domain
MSARRIQHGYLMLADISGYTSFLTGTELLHAQEIMEDLTGVILAHIEPPFRLVKLEGDAVFYYALADELPRPQRLLEQIENCYVAFSDHLRNMRRETTCTCAACASTQSLDLKFFAHFGEFLLQRVRGTAEDLAGPDVILVHRLLKNRVTETTGLRAYSLVTGACLDKTGSPSTLRGHVEEIEHLGEVSCGIEDLRARCETLRAERRIVVEDEGADMRLDRWFARQPPAVLWSYFTEPELRKKWQKLLGIDVEGTDGGRYGSGMVSHCAHGDYVRQNRVVDWRPYHYFTFDAFHEPAWRAPPSRVTVKFVPERRGDQDGTRVFVRGRLLSRTIVNKTMLWLIGNRLVAKEINGEWNELEKLLAGTAEGSVTAARSP